MTSPSITNSSVVSMNALIKILNDESKRVGILTWEDGLRAIREKCEIEWKKEAKNV